MKGLIQAIVMNKLLLNTRLLIRSLIDYLAPLHLTLHNSQLSLPLYH